MMIWWYLQRRRFKNKKISQMTKVTMIRHKVGRLKTSEFFHLKTKFKFFLSSIKFLKLQLVYTRTLFNKTLKFWRKMISTINLHSISVTVFYLDWEKRKFCSGILSLQTLWFHYWDWSLKMQRRKSISFQNSLKVQEFISIRA